MKFHYAFIFSIVIALSSCQKNSNSPSSSSLSGSNGNSGTAYESITGKWVLYQYRDGNNTNPLLRSDTLVFQDDKNYTWNGVAQKYRLYTASNIYNKYVLELNDTPFGSLRGNPPLTFKTYGEIINEPFSQIGGQTFYMWFKKVN